MSDEKISEMLSAGTLLSSDMMPVVRLGSPNLNLQTNMSGLQAFIGAPGPGQTYYHDISTSGGLVNFVLPLAAVNNETHVVKDATGGHPGTGGISVTAQGSYFIDSGTTFPPPPLYWQDFAQYTFRWNSSLNKWLVG